MTPIGPVKPIGVERGRTLSHPISHCSRKNENTLGQYSFTNMGKEESFRTFTSLSRLYDVTVMSDGNE